MIGRKNEADILKESTEKSQAQLIVVYGRRRVGKTFLVRETFPDGFFFQHTGILDVPMARATTSVSSATCVRSVQGFPSSWPSSATCT